MRSRLSSEISPTRFFSIAMRAFTISCRSFAALYSAFSRRSPSSRARWISFGRSTFSSRSSAAISSWNRFRIRSFIDKVTVPQSVMLKSGPPVRTIASRQHDVVKQFRDLAATPDPTGMRLLLDGAHLVREARRAGALIEVVGVAALRLEGATEEGALARE